MGKVAEWIIENFDFSITVAITIGIFALVSLGYIPNSQIPITTLGILITLTLFLAVKNFRLGFKVNSIAQSVESVEKQMKTLTSARVISGTNSFFHTLNSLLSENTKLDVTYFSPTPPNLLLGDSVNEYWKILNNNLKRCPEFRVRRIVVIESLQMLEWVKETIANSKNSSQYHLALLESDLPFPLLNLIVVDNQYVVLFGPHILESDSHYIFVDNPKIAEVVNEYFQNLWNVASKLKVGKRTYDDVFARIEQKLHSKQMPSA